MIKLAQINTVCYGSTGKIMYKIQEEAIKNNIQTISFFGRGNGYDLPCKKISNKVLFFLDASLSTLLGLNGHFSLLSTKKLIKQLKQYNPDIIHLHNIHGFYLNYKILFKYFKTEYKGKIIWHFHDCWPFTGHCASFAAINCNKWQKGCYKCKQKRCYPPSIFLDNCVKEYKRKKSIFSDVRNLKIIVPSNFMYENVKKSFLSSYKTILINNSIDKNIFKKYISDDNINKKYKIPSNKKIYLGVSNVWSKNKGLDIFIKMSELINENEIIVIVGLNKKQLKMLPKNIIGISRTNSQEELAKIYSMADVFINPSLEESFSLTTLESIFCGTPVVVTGNSAMKELVMNKNIGSIVDIKEYNSETFFKKAKLFDKKINSKEILKYNEKYDAKNICPKIIEIYLKGDNNNE